MLTVDNEFQIAIVSHLDDMEFFVWSANNIDEQNKSRNRVPYCTDGLLNV